MDIQITIHNNKIKKADFNERVLLKEKGEDEDFDRYINVYNSMLIEKMEHGQSDSIRNKYITVAVQAPDLESAISKFTSVDIELNKGFSRIGTSLHPLTANERIRILADVFRGVDENVPELDMKALKRKADRAFACPDYFEFKPTYFMFNDKYARCVFIKEFPSSLNDELLTDLSDSNLNIMTTVNIAPIDTYKSLTMVNHQITSMTSEKINAERKAIKGGYSPDSINYNLKYSLEQAHDLLDSTDTGIEAAKQGATYLRYIDNSKKAASNTVKTVRNIKNAPHNVKVAIKKSAQTAKKIAKAATSKGFLMIIVGFFALTILQSSINDSVAGALSVVSSTFSWLADDDDSLTDKDILNKYIKVIKDEVKDKQNEVDNVYNNFDCDRREWGSHDPIEEFRYMRFHNAPIDITTTDKYCQVLAMVTAKWYSEELLSDTPPDDLKLSKNKIRKMVDEYFDFEHHIEYDYCPHYWDCNHGTIMVGGDVNGTLYYNECYYCYWHGCKEITKWVEPKPGRTDYGSGDAWERDVHHMGVRHFCDNPNHKYLAGGVTNYSTPEVQTRLHFTDDEKAIYQMYYEEISDILK